MSEESIFIAALDMAPAQRAAYLDQICAGDGDLRARVDALLRSHEGAGSFLAQPVLQANETGEFNAVNADGASVETAGMCVGYPAGSGDAHHLVNRSRAADLPRSRQPRRCRPSLLSRRRPGARR